MTTILAFLLIECDEMRSFVVKTVGSHFPSEPAQLARDNRSRERDP